MKSEKKKELHDRALKYLEESRTDMETLSINRANWEKYFNGDLLGNEIKGRCQAVMTDISDTVESILPDLMDIFYGGQDVVSIRSKGVEDDKKAPLMEAKINFDFQKRLNGFKILYTFFKDGLVKGMGVTKYYWRKEWQYEYREIEGNDDILARYKSDPEYVMDDVVVKTPPQFDPTGTVLIMPGEYTLKMRKRKWVSMPVIENLPLEEFIFCLTKKDINDGKFCAHKKLIHIKEAKKYGLSEEDIKSETRSWSDDVERMQKYKDLGGVTFIAPEDSKDHIWLYECYFDDFDDKGNRAPKKVTIIGGNVVDVQDNQYGRPPFCVWSPIIETHRIVGHGFAEKLKEIQFVRTALLRNILDNVYFQNNGVKVVNPFRVYADQLNENNVPGGNLMTRRDVDPATAIHNLPYTPLPQQTYQMFAEMLPEIRQERSGITKYTQGMGSDALNKTAHGINQIMTASAKRLKLIAMIAAETGVRDMFEHALIKQNLMYYDEEELVKIDQTNAQIIRREDIDGEYDIVIDVGIGMGSKDLQYNQMMGMLNAYGMIAKAAGPLSFQIYQPKNIREMLREAWRYIGHKNVDKFVLREEEVGQGIGRGASPMGQQPITANPGGNGGNNPFGAMGMPTG